MRGSERYIAHWRMNGASVQQTTGPTLITPGTTFVRNGDYDGDRRTDQLWFNATDNNR